MGIRQVSFNTLINLTGNFDFVRATYESNLRISDATTQEKNFILHRDSQSIQQLEELLSEARTMAVQAQLLMTDEADKQETAVFINDLDKYRQAFSQLVKMLAADPQADITQLEHEIDRLGNHARQIASTFGAKQQQLLLRETIMAERIIVAVAVFSLLLGILIVLLITRMIVPPLQQAVEVAEKIASGDLSQNLENHRKDEPGQLINAMQRMTENLRHLMNNLTSGVSQLATATEEMAAISEQNSMGANQQRAETEQVATAINEMVATVQEVARNAEDASNAATESAQQVNLGSQLIQETMQSINQLGTEVTASAGAISELKQQTTSIGTVLDVIKSIADQTNLLALNAAIEAARAGEAGRGFAVVAEEVRALAFRTQESTVQIEELISTLQHKAEDTAASMNSNTALASSTINRANSATETFNSIAQTISNIQHMNHQIAAAALQQSTVAEEINRSVISIRDIAEQSAAASEETAAASADLSRLGTELQNVASKFRL